ncbi:MAG: bifunctional DNA primase/polymerase [Bifidobacteriaceae bacterium]|nr:bifunctional DNA primase/polymerase [Bifidobacteriaceae bacterium]
MSPKTGRHSEQRRRLRGRLARLADSYIETGEVDLSMVRRPKAQPASASFAALLAGWGVHMAVSGWAAETVDQHAGYARRYLLYLEAAGVGRIEEAVAGSLAGFLDSLKPAVAARSVRAVPAVLRAFLGFAGRHDLALAAGQARCERARVPLAVLSDRDTEAVAAGGDGPVCLQDRAITVLALTTGLRACDICGLVLGYIDWRAGRVSLVQQKTGSPLTLPLPRLWRSDELSQRAITRRLGVEVGGGAVQVTILRVWAHGLIRCLWGGAGWVWVVVVQSSRLYPPARSRAETALCAAKAGVRVFPVSLQTGKPLNPRGLSGASADPDTVWQWWQDSPNANIGVPTGPGEPGQVTYDVVTIAAHGEVAGFATAAELNDQGALSGWVMVAERPDGGIDVYYPANPLGQQTQVLAGGMKINGVGSWVLAPSSVMFGARGVEPIRVTHTASAVNARPVDGRRLAGRIVAWAAHHSSQHDGILAVMADAWQHWRTNMPGSWAETYLEQRGIALEAGVALDGPRDGLLHHLAGKGWTIAQMESAGLVHMAGRTGAWQDRFRDRVLFPIVDDSGRVIAVTGRLNPASPHSDFAPKYLNNPRTAIFDKGRSFLGWGPETISNLKAGATPVLVEGPADLAAVNTALDQYPRGFGRDPDVVVLATCGTAVTHHHIAILRDVCPGSWRVDGINELTLAFDPDQAGHGCHVADPGPAHTLRTRLRAGRLVDQRPRQLSRPTRGNEGPVHAGHRRVTRPDMASRRRLHRCQGP